MLFGNSNANNNSEKKSVTTRGGIDLRNENGFEPSMVSFDFWKGCLSLRIHPAIPEEKRTEFKKFDFDTTMTTALTPQNAHILLSKIKTTILPALENNQKKFVGVQVNGDGLVGIGTGRKDGSEPYLAIFKGLNPTTKKPETGMIYAFKKNALIEDYDFNTGEFDIVDLPEVEEIKLFMCILDETIKSATNAQTHSFRNVQDWYNTTMMDLIKQIAKKNGVAVPESGYGRNTDVFGGNSYGGGKASQKEDLPFEEEMNIVSEEVDSINQFLN